MSLVSWEKSSKARNQRPSQSYPTLQIPGLSQLRRDPVTGVGRDQRKHGRSQGPKRQVGVWFVECRGVLSATGGKRKHSFSRLCSRCKKQCPASACYHTDGRAIKNMVLTPSLASSRGKTRKNYRLHDLTCRICQNSPQTNPLRKKGQVWGACRER